MAITYFESDKVKMYPSAHRDAGINLESKLHTEKNLTGVGATALYEENSYIAKAGDDAIKAVIGGYRFDIDLTGATHPTNCWFVIRLSDFDLTADGQKSTKLVS